MGEECSDSVNEFEIPIKEKLSQNGSNLDDNSNNDDKQSDSKLAETNSKTIFQLTVIGVLVFIGVLFDYLTNSRQVLFLTFIGLSSTLVLEFVDYLKSK